MVHFQFAEMKHYIIILQFDIVFPNLPNCNKENITKVKPLCNTDDDNGRFIQFRTKLITANFLNLRSIGVHR